MKINWQGLALQLGIVIGIFYVSKALELPTWIPWAGAISIGLLAPSPFSRY